MDLDSSDNFNLRVLVRLKLFNIFSKLKVYMEKIQMKK